jgi:anti-sigma regulatory factor (Ser/Thr protein kinase)
MESLSVAGRLDALQAIGEYVLQAAAQAGLEGQAAYRLRLAVDEIATNAILHGYQPAAYQGELLVTAVCDESKLTITLEDSSPAYNPLRTPPPENLDGEPQERPSGGLGIFLALRGVNEFQYQWVNKKNRNIFVQFIIARD